MEDNYKQSGKDENMKNAGIAGASGEIVQRYGAAVKEHFVAYCGEDRETGEVLTKSLKSIANSKKNSNYQFQNEHQAAGFAAEVKSVARTNAENIIKKNPVRRARTDDRGRVNDQYADTVLIDANGNEVSNSEVQIKFIGASKNDPKGLGDAQRTLKKLQSKKYDKYFEKDIPIEVPKDLYDKIIKSANDEISKLKNQLELQKRSGNAKTVAELQRKIEKLECIKKNLRKSNVSSREAISAVKNAEISTAKDVINISHRAGLQAAGIGAAVGGSISIVKNLVELSKGQIETDEAIGGVVKETIGAAAMGYGTGFTGAALKGAMQNSKSTYIQALSKSNLPATIVSVSVAASATMTKYFKGDIDGTECLVELGENGTSMVASALFATVGQGLISSVVGGLIGGMLGYAVASASYGILVDALQNAKLASEERLRIEKECDEHIKLIQEYRLELDQLVNDYLKESSEIFRLSYKGVKDALMIGDVDRVIDEANSITKSFGGTPPFSSMEDFEEKMLSSDSFKL